MPGLLKGLAFYVGRKAVKCPAWLIINLLILDKLMLLKKALNPLLKCVNSPALPEGWRTGVLIERGIISVNSAGLLLVGALR